MEASVPELTRKDAALLFDAITQAANLAGLGVLITRSNPDGTQLELIYFNAGIERMTGRSRTEILEARGLFPFVPAEQRSLLSGLNAARIRGESLPSTFAAALVHVSGRHVPIEVTLVPITLADRALNVSFVVDMTQRELAEQALQHSREKAHKQAAINLMAAGVAHEINNPLAYVLLNLEFLARELNELAGIDRARLDAMQKRLEHTLEGAIQVKTIVSDLLALTRKDEDIRGPVELDQVITHALQMAKRELRARVLTDFRSVPVVSGNPTRLERLFYNLIVNAAYALGEHDAEPWIRVSLAPSADGQVVAEIADNGCGMADEAVARAFEPFYTTKPLGVGAGLGLAICKRIVDDLAGTITIRSELGRGTTVSIALPADQQQAKQAGRQHEQPEIVQ